MPLRTLTAIAGLLLATAVSIQLSHATVTTTTPATQSDIQKAADFLLENTGGELRVQLVGGYYMFTTASGEVMNAAKLAVATGTEINDGDMSAVLAAASSGEAAIQRTSCANTDTASGSACSTGNLCSDMGACSLYGDLASAQGDQRDRYLAQKSQDGQTYEAMELPEFEARDVSGETVSSTTLLGRPTLLAMLAPHCGHSIRSLSTLKRLERRYGPKGVNVVGVFVNTSTIASAKSRAEELDITYPLWTYASDDLGDTFDTHLAPTTLLVDAAGNVREKLVGEKTERELAARLDVLLSDSDVKLGALTR